jgi:hypothetical protein
MAISAAPPARRPLRGPLRRLHAVQRDGRCTERRGRVAKTTRAHLQLAGVTRPRLYENTATTMHVGFRSWRDTGITWLALAGVDAAKIQRRAGHDDVATSIGYVKQAEDVTGKLGEPFPPLPTCLVSPDAKDARKSREWANDWAKRRYRPLEPWKKSGKGASPAGSGTLLHLPVPRPSVDGDGDDVVELLAVA